MKPKFTFDSSVQRTCKHLMVGAALILASMQPVIAQDGASRDQVSDHSGTNVVERYSSGSIRSVEAADSALKDVEQARAQVEAQYADEERECHSKFFMTSCIDAAKEMRRRALAEIQKIEVEANGFKRRARVEERDKALADKSPATAPIIKSAKEPKIKDPAATTDEVRPVLPSERPVRLKRTGRDEPTRDRVAEHNEKLERLKAKEAAGAQERAANVAAFEKKASESAERQRKIEAKKEEKERGRPAKNSSDTPAQN